MDLALGENGGIEMTEELPKDRLESVIFATDAAAYAANPEILHLVPKRCLQTDKVFLGSTKDVLGRLEIFESLDLEFATVPLLEDETAWSKARLNIKRLKNFVRDLAPEQPFKMVIFDMPGSCPGLAAHVRKMFPMAKLVFRSHNAEFFHRLDRVFYFDSWADRLRLFGIALKQPLRDRRMVAAVDEIWTISEIDSKFYWKPLSASRGRGAKVSVMPYFMAEKYKSMIDTSALRAKTDSIVCISSGRTKPGRIEPNVEEFFDFVEKHGNSRELEGWTFEVTGSLQAGARPAKVKELGYLPTPFDAVARSKYVFLYADSGWGFKTKILDALLCDNVLVVSKGMYRKLPKEVRPQALVVGGFKDLRRALAESAGKAEVYAGFRLNESLKNQATRVFTESWRSLCH